MMIIIDTQVWIPTTTLKPSAHPVPHGTFSIETLRNTKVSNYYMIRYLDLYTNNDIINSRLHLEYNIHGYVDMLNATI